MIAPFEARSLLVRPSSFRAPFFFRYPLTLCGDLPLLTLRRIFRSPGVSVYGICELQPSLEDRETALLNIIAIQVNN